LLVVPIWEQTGKQTIFNVKKYFLNFTFCPYLLYVPTMRRFLGCK
jgi:hypothetical protein